MVTHSMARRSLDKRLNHLQPTSDLKPPSSGWIKALREALGMTTAQLARRLGVTQPNIVRLERSEAKCTVTLESLDKAAQALDCTLVYALVPNRPLETMVLEQAEKLASKHLLASGHSMRLENQGIGQNDERELARQLVDDLMRGKQSRLWDNS